MGGVSVAKVQFCYRWRCVNQSQNVKGGIFDDGTNLSSEIQLFQSSRQEENMWSRFSFSCLVSVRNFQIKWKLGGEK